MSAPPPDRPVLDQLVSLARSAAPPDLAQTDVRRAVRRARLAGAARAAKARARRLAFRVALGCAALGALLLLLPSLRQRLAPHMQPPRAAVAASAPSAKLESKSPAPTPPTQQATPVRVRLPSGDQLLTTPDTRFDLRKASEREREVALERGTGLFEVDPLARGERFSVRTPHVQIEVRGTVFSVEVDAKRTRVRVYEGKVAVAHVDEGVAQAHVAQVLAEGARYGSDSSSFEEDLARPEPLRSEALAMAARRRSASAAHAPKQRTEDAGPGLDPPSAVHNPLPAPRPLAPQPSALEATALMREANPLSALLSARRALTSDLTPSERASWLALQGDSLRRLGRPAEAIASYRAALPELERATREQVAFKAADLALRELGTPEIALELLDSARVDAEGSSLRERALLLRIEALSRTGAPVDGHAESYLRDYPDSAGAARVRELRAR